MRLLQGEGEQSGGLFQLYILHFSSPGAVLLSLNSSCSSRKGARDLGSLAVAYGNAQVGQI